MAIIDSYLSQYAAHQRTTDPSWLQAQQTLALETIRQTGFPTAKNEDWKYTDIRPLLKRDFSFVGKPPLAIDNSLLDAARISGLDCHELVFINGHYSADHSQPEKVMDGIIIKPLAQVIAEEADLIRQHLNQYSDTDKNAFSAMNTAFIQDGTVIVVADGMQPDRPVHIIYLSDQQQPANASNPRNLIVLGRNSSATVIETYSGAAESEYFTNTITEISLGQGALLEHYKLQQEGPGGFHIGNVQVQQQRDSHFTSHSISLGGKLVRNDIDVKLLAPGAEAVLNGLYITDKSQHVDNHTRIDHLSAHTTSTEVYRGVLSGRSRGVFNGKVVVHKDAQKTSADQSNANLLLSNDAEIDTKPELEIYADDVKCSHGATIGQLDENMLFYLRSRAIPEDLARSLLTFAFTEAVISRIKLAPVRRRLEQRIVGQLPDADMIREFVQ
jgi:Fe-S cluster assembly protein SufD